MEVSLGSYFFTSKRFFRDVSVARYGLVPSKHAAKLSVSGAEGSWGRRGQLAATRLPVTGSRAGPGAVLSAVFNLQMRGKECNKVCFPLFLPFFIPDLSSDRQISSSTRIIKKDD